MYRTRTESMIGALRVIRPLLPQGQKHIEKTWSLLHNIKYAHKKTKSFLVLAFVGAEYANVNHELEVKAHVSFLKNNEYNITIYE